MRINENPPFYNNPNKQSCNNMQNLKLLRNVFDNYKIPQQEYICENDATYVAPAQVKEIHIVGRSDAVIRDCQINWNRNTKIKGQLFHGSANDLNSCLKGTKLEGMGQAFIDAQEKYGVNALFLMAIAKVESSYGKAPAEDKSGVHKYNIAGLKKRGGGYQNNESYEQCINSCASSLKRLYFNAKPARNTLLEINRLYCSGNLKWSSKIAEEMNRLTNIISKNYT